MTNKKLYKYRLKRVIAGEVQSSNPLRDDDIDFQDELDIEAMYDSIQIDESFSFLTAPKIKEADARWIRTSHVKGVYTIDENSLGFITETGSKYIVEKINE